MKRLIHCSAVVCLLAAPLLAFGQPPAPAKGERATSRFRKAPDEVPGVTLVPVRGAKAAKPDRGAFDDFNGWVAEHRAGTAKTDGVGLARKRTAALAKLIESDPEAALALSVKPGERKGLPAAVAAELEQPVRGVGSLAVVCAFPTDTAEHVEIQREVVVNGKHYRAFTFGHRLEQQCTLETPIFGIAVGDVLAFGETPYRLLDGAEADEARDAFRGPVEDALTGEKIPPGKPVYGIDEGDRVVFFGSTANLNAYLTQEWAPYIAEFGGSNGGPGNPNSWTQGTRRFIAYRARLAEDAPTYEPYAYSSGLAAFNTVSNWYYEWSYGSCTMQFVVAATTYAFTNSGAWYEANGGWPKLLADCRTVSLGIPGEAYTNFDFDSVTHNWNVGLSGYAGVAYVGGRGVSFHEGYGADNGVVGHEHGHNLGLPHNNFWNTSGQSIFGPGSHEEYGNEYDIMGNGYADWPFAANMRNRLWWLPDTNTAYNVAPGTYRIFAFDQISLVNDPAYPQTFALALPKDGRNYVFEYRQDTNRIGSNQSFLNGVLVEVDGGFGGGPELLDCTPGSSGGKGDSPLTIGRTFSDPNVNLHVTPIARGPTSRTNWIDLVVNRNTQLSNQPPALAVSASSYTTAVGVAVTLTATAADPDGDTLAYYWDFSNGSPSYDNSPVQSKSWSAAGVYQVRCVASDRRGREASDSVLITVGSPGAKYTISGRVTTPAGAPVQGVRLVNGGASVYSDPEGRYTLANLSAGSHTVTANGSDAYGNNYNFTYQFANPVTVGPDAIDRDVVASLWTGSTGPGTGFLYERWNNVSGGTVANLTSDPRYPNSPDVQAVKVGTFEGGNGIGDNYGTRMRAIYIAPQTGTYYFYIASDDYSELWFSTTTNPASATKIAYVNGWTDYRQWTKFASQKSAAISLNAGQKCYIEALQAEGGGGDHVSVGADLPDATQERPIPTHRLDPYVSGGAAPAATVSIAATDSVATEPTSDTGAFTLTRTGDTTGPLTVTFQVGGTATYDVDYQPIGVAAAFGAGQATTTVTVTPKDDTAAEPVETVTLTVLPGATHAVSGGSATVDLRDNEATVVNIYATDSDAAEAGGNPGRFAIVRSGNSDSAITVPYAINGTASNGVDYTALSGSASLAAGASFAYLTVSPIADGLTEVGETINLTIQAGAGYALGTATAATVRIQGEATLVAWYPMDEGSGTVAVDATGYGNNGTASGVAWAAGRIGLSMVFNGPDYVTLPASAFADVNGSITVSMWVNGDAALQPQQQSVVYATDAAGNRVLNIHLPWSDSNVYWDAGNSGSASYDRINKVATASQYEGVWNHWVFTKNASSGVMNIYVNGALWHTGSGLTRTMAGITAAKIGANTGGTLNYDGLIDDVRFYRTELNSSEVYALYLLGNAAPVANDDTVTTVEDTAVSIPVLANDTDADGDALSIGSYAQGAHGAVAQNGTNLVYTPSSNYNGPDAFTYVVSDGHGGSDTGLVSVTVNNGDNDAPAFTADPIVEATAMVDDAYVSTLSDNATDTDLGDTLTFSKTSGPAWLTVAPGGGLSGTPALGDAGLNSFVVRVTDAGGLFDEATLQITVKQGLQAWWAFDENTGTTAADSSGNGNNGTVTGAAWIGGAAGSGLDFEGADYVTVPATAFTNVSTEIAIAMWVNGDAAYQPQDQSVIEAVDASNYRVFNVHLPWSNGNVYWDCGNAGASYDRIFKAATAADYEGGWNHWVFTKNAATGAMKIYLNGVLWHSGTGLTRTMGGIAQAKIGSNYSGASNYDGIVDEVRVYNVALSAQQVWDLFTGYGDLVAPRLTTPANVTIECDQSSVPPATGTATATDDQDPAPVVAYSDQAFSYTLNNSLTMYLKLNEGIGAPQALDSSGLGYHATTQAGVTQGADGKAGTAYTFNGSTGYLTANPSAGVWGSGNFTMSAWIKTTSAAQTAIVNQHGYDGTANDSLQFGINASGKAFLYLSSAYYGINWIATGATPVNNGQWHHVTVVRSGQYNTYVYVDGALDGTGYRADGWIGVNPNVGFAVGRHADGGQYFNGQLDEVAIWQRQLSATEIAQTYAEGQAGRALDEPVSPNRTIRRTWTATDNQAHSSSGLQIVTIRDTTAPVMSCPANVTLAADANCLAAVPDWAGTLLVTDNCDTFSVIQNPSAGAPVGLGTTVVTVTATDASGNATVCTPSVTVEDTTPPTLDPPASVTVACGSDTTPAALGTATATDNCTASPTIGYSDVVNGTCPATITRTWTATDAASNVGSAVQTIGLYDPNSPPAFTSDPIVEAGATEDAAYSGTIADDATDPNAGDTLTFSKLSGPAWLSVAADGTISGTPGNGDVGLNNFTVRVADQVGASDTATLQITVANVNDAPYFLGDPITGTQGTVGQAYGGTLAGTAADVDAGDTLTYSKVSGPAWLSVAANGALSGTPGAGNVGLNGFVVRVTDLSAASDDAALNITVAGTPVVTLTSPTNGTVIATAPATIGLAATVDPQGMTITSVQFLNGTNVVASDASVPYAYTWTNVAAGTYGLKARAQYSGSPADSATSTVTVIGVPAPWLVRDIGTNGLPGSAGATGTMYTVKGVGTLSGTSDRLCFVYQTLSGDGEIRARIPAYQNTGTGARLGAMIRDTLNANSRYSFIGINGSGAYYQQRRTSTGGSTSTTTSGSGTAPNIWVRVTRTGNRMVCYKSTNGTSWTQVDSRNINMASSCHLGLVVSSGSSTNLNTSTFDNITAVP